MAMHMLLLLLMLFLAAAFATWILSMFVPCAFLERAIGFLTALVLVMMASVTVWSAVERLSGP